MSKSKPCSVKCVFLGYSFKLKNEYKYLCIVTREKKMLNHSPQYLKKFTSNKRVEYLLSPWYKVETQWLSQQPVGPSPVLNCPGIEGVLHSK